MKKRLSPFVSFVLAFCVLSVAGCDWAGEEEDLSSRLRLINLSPPSADEIKDYVPEDRDEVVGRYFSKESLANLVVDGDSLARRIPYSRGAGYRPVKGGVPINIEVRSTADNSLWFGMEKTLQEETAYTLIAVGRRPGNVEPILLREEREELPQLRLPLASENQEEEGEIKLEGRAGIRVLHASVSGEPVDVYVNRPAEDDAEEPTVEELEPVFTEVGYKEITDKTTYNVSIDPESEIGNSFRIRLTPAGDTEAVYDRTLSFEPDQNRVIILRDNPLDYLNKAESVTMNAIIHGFDMNTAE